MDARLDSRCRRVCEQRDCDLRDWTPSARYSLLDLLRAQTSTARHHAANEVQLSHLALDQDRRLPRGLRLLLAIGARRDRPQGREADGRRRRARRRAPRPRRRARSASAWARPGASPRTATCDALCAMVRGREGDGPRDLHDARHADREPGAGARRRRPRLLQPQSSTPRPNIMARSSPRGPSRSGSTRWSMSATPASRSAAAGSSAWARAARTASASSTRSRPCRAIPKACRSTRWCRSRARCSATCSPARRWRRSTTSSSSAPSPSPASPCRARWSACRPAARACREATQALCFLAGANRIFTGDKLLTTGNAGGDADAALFAKLGLRAMTRRGAVRAVRGGMRRGMISTLLLALACRARSTPGAGIWLSGA